MGCCPIFFYISELIKGGAIEGNDDIHTPVKAFQPLDAVLLPHRPYNDEFWHEDRPKHEC
jgi:hypothetical protein